MVSVEIRCAESAISEQGFRERELPWRLKSPQENKRLVSRQDARNAKGIVISPH